MITYGIIFVVLLLAELAYFKIADRFNIIDKPNERSSHSTIVLRGGGIIFTIAVVVWAMVKMINDEGLMINDCYPWFVLGVVLVAGVSFVDDIRSLPDSVRLVVQFAAMGLMFVQLFVSSPDSAIAGVRAVGEGGVCAGGLDCVHGGIGMLVMKTGDVTWLVFLLVYGVDGVLTICHRIMLHENLGEAHRKHAYQLMANELKMSHPLVSGIYMGLQLVVSLGFIGMTWVMHDNHNDNDDIVLAHWMYLIGAAAVLAVAYVVFKRRYYHLHEEYLASIARDK